MPMHDWTRVEAGIFHAFLHGWISTLNGELNRHSLPHEFYALIEKRPDRFAPDVLNLKSNVSDADETDFAGGMATAVQTQPQTRFTSETSTEFYLRKKSSLAIRHVSGDRIVAMIEIVSPGNKSSDHAVDAFIRKACELLEHRIHLLILDPFPPGPRDPNGIHAAIWQRYADEPFALPADKPLTFVAYECDLTTRAYIEPLAVGDELPEMPLFLAPKAYVPVPLEKTYNAAFEVMPRRWRSVLQT